MTNVQTPRPRRHLFGHCTFGHSTLIRHSDFVIRHSHSLLFQRRLSYSPLMLAIVNFQNPLFWAILVGWIMSVVLHEFAHGIVAYWGGDYTIRERGGLTLNPLQYVDPVFSILLPVIFLAMGGIPLPGGSTYVRRDLLRSRQWDSAVSLAGPAMNLLLFFACAIPLHPKVGWLDQPFGETSTAQSFLGAMAFLQFTAAVFNLFPVPPLDGFQTIAPWLPSDLRMKLSTPPLSNYLFIGFFVIIWKLPVLDWIDVHLLFPLLNALGFGDAAYYFWIALGHALN
jgi:Zn-dependent protease